MIFSFSDYPLLLKNISRPPSRLKGIGNQNCLELPCVAIVGTRKPSPSGLRAAFQFGKEIGDHGYSIVSGLARGIDGAAHRGALKSRGKTVAILGHGFSRPFYPVEHNELAGEIVKRNGLILTEYEDRVPPLPHHFPERNRIIAGLAQAVVVIEASKKSGSLITALLALEAGRDVFVLPGNFDDGGFEGSHKLIKEGATLVTAPEDVLGSMGKNLFTKKITDDAIGKLFHATDEVLTLEDLWERSQLSVPELSAAIETRLVTGELFEISPHRYVWISVGCKTN